MPLPGGATDKAGNEYERYWTVRVLVDLLAEDLLKVRLEPPGEDGFEFATWSAEGQTFHQVKRQTFRGHWTLGQLNQERVLRNFFDKLNQGSTKCVFVSTHNASELSELAERARAATSTKEFVDTFNEPRKWETALADLCAYWGGVSNEAAYEALRRICVTTIDQSSIETLVRARIETLIEGDSDAVFDRLHMIATESVHEELTAHALWYRLEHRGVGPRRWADNRRVNDAVRTQNDRIARRLRREMIPGVQIARDETDEVLDKILERVGRTTLLTGGAGSGKSTVLLHVLEGLADRELPYLALRVDELQPVSTTRALGDQLGLPGSPANVLAGIAVDRPSVLIVDQLDAVSVVSGRHTSVYERIEDLIEEATSAHTNIHVIVACRSFDLEHDHRFQSLMRPPINAARVPVGHLSPETVAETLSSLGIEARTLTPTQRELLRLPLHLKLFAELSVGSGAVETDFASSLSLFDHFWDRKRALLARRLERPVKWTEVVDRLCNFMSENQVLTAPTAVLDDFLEDADAMASERVLRIDENDAGFFHESFFDYAFARRFAVSNDIMGFLVGDEQHLFRRSQVRQVLLYERSHLPDRYIAHLRAILEHGHVRFHIKQLALALLSDIHDPMESEWAIVERIAFDQYSALTKEAAKPIVSSTAWFDLLDELRAFEQLLQRERAQDRQIVAMALSNAASSRPARVAHLLRSYVAHEPEWQPMAVHIGALGELRNRELFNVVTELVDAGIGDHHDFWELLHVPAQNAPELACKLLKHYIERGIRLADEAGIRNPFEGDTATIRGDDSAIEIVETCARHSPEAFIEATFTSIVRLLQAPSHPPDSELAQSEIWPSGYWEQTMSLEAALLHGLQEALASLCSEQQPLLRSLLEELRRTRSVAAHQLVVRTFLACGRDFSQDVYEYLLEDPAALGNDLDQTPAKGARALVNTIWPRLDDEALGRLIETILSYSPDWELRPRPRRGNLEFPITSAGWSRFILLDAIPAERLPLPAARAHAELARRFPYAGEVLAYTDRGGVTVETVPSPIGVAQAKRMTDEQWLGAIARYNAGDRLQPGRRLKGGAPQLAQVLETMVRDDPTRYVGLLDRMPDDASTHYFSAVLRGLSQAHGANPHLLLRALERCQAMAGRPCAMDMLQAIRSFIERGLPSDAWGILADLATTHPDPQTSSTDYLTDEAPDGGFTMQGVNSVRGAAAELIGLLMFKEHEAESYFEGAIEAALSDPVPSVRGCASIALTAMLRTDPDRAVGRFLESVREEDDRILAMNQVQRFLGFALRERPSDLAPVIERMLDSPFAPVKKAGAIRACVAELDVGDESWGWIHRCLAGDANLREGAAEVLATNVDAAPLRKTCAEGLLRLFSDENPSVRKTAARCFSEIGAERIDDYSELVEGFVASPALLESSNSLFLALVSSSRPIPRLTCSVCKAWLDRKDQWSTSEDGWITGAFHLTELAIRSYSQALNRGDTETSRSCLNLLDRVLSSGISDSHNTLDAFDR